MSQARHYAGPSSLYQADLAKGLILADKAQQAAIEALEQRYRYLLAKWDTSPSIWQRTRHLLNLKPREQKLDGLYFWGGVGRGKTYLMDLFFHSLPGDRKMRMHFHRFMLMVHERLNAEQGSIDPLEQVAASIANKVDIICFDEFFVSDIGDAMILANLLEALFSLGVMLVATSNIVPERLYERGLQRQNFLPAIALLNAHTTVMNIDGGVDYRLQSLDKVPVYLTPLSAANAQALQELFAQLTRGQHIQAQKTLEIAGREFTAELWAEGIVWFDFATLCKGPRSAADYIELARQYHTVFIAGLPSFHEDGADDEARRFITLVDEFYDHGVKLIVSAEQELEKLYQGSQLRFPFERTVSRMLEMQTREYLSAEHHPD